MGKAMMKILVAGLFTVAVVVIALLIGKMPVTAPAAGISQSSGTGYEGGKIQPHGEIDTNSSDTARRLSGNRPSGPYIVIDRYCNKLFLRTARTILLEALCSTGSGGDLIDTLTGRQWRFDTPPGVYAVDTKLKNPWWRKPDWAFIEEGIPLPKNAAERLDDQMMGDYAIGFGDGYFIHGTIYERLLGKAVTHGCVRLAAADLKKLYDNTKTGTLIYVY
jgi:L,D-transpeptidase YbiS